jgi:apolipoprotein N-acyltransferase
MQSSEVAIKSFGTPTSSGWLERFSLLEKAPFAFFFGAILGTSTPGFDHSMIAWFGLAPLLVLVRSARTHLEATFIGLTFGLGYYLVALSWYLGLFPLRWLGLDDWVAVQAVGCVWTLESLHESILFAIFAWLVYALPMRSGFVPHIHRPFFPYMISVPVIWVFVHWVIATSVVFLGMPVNQLAYTQHGYVNLLQVAKYFGSGGVDFMLLLSNCAVAALIFEFTPLATRLQPRIDQISPKLGAGVDVIFASFVVALATTWGADHVRSIARMTQAENPANFMQQTPAVPVAVLQGNISIEGERLKTVSPTEVANIYSQLGSNKGEAILILPEAAVGVHQFGPGLLLSRLKGICDAEKKEAITGSVEQSEGSVINALRMIASPQPKKSLYVMQRLVPFGDAPPFGPFSHISSQMTASVTGEGGESVVTATSAKLLDSVFGKVGASISTELVFPALIADEVRRGASLLVNVTNLNRFHNASLNKQVIAAATLRAVENERYVVVATNTGISAVIDPSGIITSRSHPGMRGLILDKVQFLYKETPFSRMTRMWWI